jgi:hypothetical protein
MGLFEEQTITMELKEQERQLIDMLREWDQLGDYRLTIEQHGEWDVALQQQGTKRMVRGTGPTFAEAWDRMDLAPTDLQATSAERI